MSGVYLNQNDNLLTISYFQLGREGAGEGQSSQSALREIPECTKHTDLCEE